jgi:hypothetical protein
MTLDPQIEKLLEGFSGDLGPPDRERDRTPNGRDECCSLDLRNMVVSNDAHDSIEPQIRPDFEHVRSRIPAVLRSSFSPSGRTSSNAVADYWAVAELLIDAIAPAHPLEWLYLRDAIYWDWELVNARRQKGILVAQLESEAVQETLSNLFARPNCSLEQLKRMACQFATSWRTQPEVLALLQKHNIDPDALIERKLLEKIRKRVEFDPLEACITRAERHRNAALAEIEKRREKEDRLQKSLRRASQQFTASQLPRGLRRLG